MFRSCSIQRVPESLGSVLNALAGVFHILAKAVGSVTADPDQYEEGGDE